MNSYKQWFAIPFSVLLVACDGGSGSVKTGSFSLGVSDNPANVEGVTIAFKRVVLKGAETFSFGVSDNGDPKQVDLMQFTGADIEGLLSAQQIPVGEYQLCLYMLNNKDGNEPRSFVRTTLGADEGLATNSNGSCGEFGVDDEDDDVTGRLFFNKKFTIAAGENNYVAEFNLEKGLLSPRGNKAYWTLKPTSVQLINNAEVGSISGQVSDTIMDSCRTAAGGNEFSDRVYLYPDNSGLVSSSAPSIQKMVDFRPDVDVGPTEVAPLAAATVQEVKDADDNITGYDYEFGFVTAATYSLGYSCLAQLDDQEVNDMATGSSAFFLFAEQTGVVVSNAVSSVRDF